MNAALKPLRKLVVNTLLVLAANIFWAAASLKVIITSENAYAIFGSFILFPMTVTASIILFLAVFRRRLTASKFATLMCYAFSGFTIFGLLSNIAEAATTTKEVNSDVQFWIVFVAVMLALAAYSAFYATVLLYWTRRLEEEIAVRPKGPTEISRGLSEAQPPDTRSF